MSGVVDVRTDAGLRRAVLEIRNAGSWDIPLGHLLLAEVRRHALRNAARVSVTTGAAADRGLAVDLLSAAWTVLHRHPAEVTNADRPWAYLMYSAERQVAADARAQQLLTSASAVRGRARELLPARIRLVGAAPAELAVAFRHEPSSSGSGSVVRQVGHRDARPLLDQPAPRWATLLTDREPWYSAFIELLLDHGADGAVTTSAVDRLADLFTTTAGGLWECEARRDPVLARLGLSADQCGALVALMAGSRRFRHNGKDDSLLLSTRSAHPRGRPVSLSAAQQRRMAKYVGHKPANGTRLALTCETSLRRRGPTHAEQPSPGAVQREARAR